MTTTQLRTECPECGRAVAKSGMVAHMRSHDPNLPEMKCPLCPQTFTFNGPLAVHVLSHTSEETRFWAFVDKDGPNGCWIWTGTKDFRGYGRFRSMGPMVKAYRFSWELRNGPIPEGLEIDHLCRNKLCVNPDHLEPVTHEENMRRCPTTTGKNQVCPNCGHRTNAGNLSKHLKRCISTSSSGADS